MLGSKHRSLRLLLAAAVLGLSCLCARAQTFSAHLTHSSTGEGAVTINQDQRLTNLLDYGVQTSVLTEQEEETSESTPTKRKKMLGFRIQMYWGNAQRSDKEQADRIGERVTALYPELEAYTSFSSPHWRCRVGDFPTRSEAAEYLTKLRRISSDAMIVKSEIYVDQ